jgi:hypothetical protein
VRPPVLAQHLRRERDEDRRHDGRQDGGQHAGVRRPDDLVRRASRPVEQGGPVGQHRGDDSGDERGREPRRGDDLAGRRREGRRDRHEHLHEQDGGRHQQEVGVGRQRDDPHEDEGQQRGSES